MLQENNKYKIRMVWLGAYILKNRCRKEQYTTIEAIGMTDKEALENLEKELAKKKPTWKKYRFTKCKIFDAEKSISNGISCTSFPMFPNDKDNLIEFEYRE